MTTVQTNWQLDHDNNRQVPLHSQFEAQMKEHILSGAWKPGEQIPSERELMAQTGLSRTTIRQVIAALVHQNILEKAHGAGTFVKHPRFEQPLNVAYSFSEQLRKLGFQLEDTILDRHLIVASPDLATKLQIPDGSQVIYVHRLRLLSGTPVMVSKAYIPYHLCPGLVSDPFDQSLYRMLVERYHLPIIRATEKLEAMHPDRDLTHLLRLPPRIPLMYVERIATTRDDVVLHLGLNYIRGDMCYFRIDLVSQPPTLAIKPLSSASE